MKGLHWDKNGLKHGAWSPEEDELLISYIRRYKIWNWSQMPKFAGLSRSGKSCRLRWMNYLRPDLKRGNITEEEEEIIVNMYAQMGSRWSKIAARLPGRTDNEIKNYWHTHLKASSKNHLQKNRKKREIRTADVAAEATIVGSNESNYTSTIFSEGSIDSYIASEGSNSKGSGSPQVMICSNMPIADSSSSTTSSLLGLDDIKETNDATNKTSKSNKQQVLIQPCYQEPENFYVFNSDDQLFNWFA